ncbi:MAG: ABC transporter ATP-binding protein [Candidatus Altiarchaeota archaeon]|nr:ABC transporter ATP-binding protein [Candidatus Altiarchaeota archaeon]
MVKKVCILEMEKVWKVYLMGKVQVPAIRGVDFCTDKGEYIAIVGPSGSGKSTLLNLIGCLDTPTAGRILLGGADISKMSEDGLARVRRKMIGFVFQTFNLMPGLTAQENVALPMRFDGVPKGLALKKAAALLELVGLGGRLKHKPAELSGGERQRVAIARALVNDPQIILADEPTGNLDTKSGLKIIEVLENLNSKGITLIVITHDAKLSERARRSLHLVDGKFMDDGEFQVNNNKNKKSEAKK